MNERAVPLNEGAIDLTAPPFTYVYRAYDASGNLLYVGISDRLRGRLEQHRLSSPWFAHAVTVEWETYADRAVACCVEAELIQGLRPRFNDRHNRESQTHRMERVRVMRSRFTPMDRSGA